MEISFEWDNIRISIRTTPGADVLGTCVLEYIAEVLVFVEIMGHVL